jgi:hypothetical protein
MNKFLAIILVLFLSCTDSNQSVTGSSYRQEYQAITIGDYGDNWYSTSGDKVVDISSSGDGDYIYMLQNLSITPTTKQKKLYVKMVLGDDTLTSQFITLDTGLHTFEFLSSVAPDSSAWTITKFNNMQGTVIDVPLTTEQSYVFEQEEASNSISRAGFEIVANWGYSNPPNYNEIKLKVHQIRKIRIYVQ